MIRVAVVMPAFNECASVRAVAEAVLAQGVGRLIAVDDGSTDGTAQALAGLDLDLLVHPTNLGKGFALASGLRRALGLGYRRILTIDADGQHAPEDLPRLLAESLADPRALIVAARIRRREAAPPLRRFANRVADFWISWACGRPICDTQSGLRLYPAAFLESVPLEPRPGQGFAFETGLLIDLVQAGAAVRTVAIETRYESGSRASHYRPWRDTWSIVSLVGASLLRRGLYPLGLARALGLVRVGPPGAGKAASLALVESGASESQGAAAKAGCGDPRG